MKITKMVGVAALSTALALSMTACGSGQGGDQESSNTITIWTLTMEDTQQKAWDALIDGFKESNPGVDVVTETRSVDAHKDALRQSAGTGTGPDLYRYWAGSGLGGELVDVGMSVDLTKYYDQYGWDDILTPPSLATVTQYGGHHGVPLLQATEAVFYNKKLFKDAGVTELPKTYDEWTQTADKLKAAGVTPASFGGTVNWHVMRLLDSIIETKCGVDKADELNTGDGNWGTEPCVSESFTELKKWGDEYLNTGFMAISNDDAAQLFWGGKSAMTIEGDWFGPQSTDNGMNAEDIGIFPIPTETGRTYGFGESLYMTPDSKNPDLTA